MYMLPSEIIEAYTAKFYSIIFLSNLAACKMNRILWNVLSSLYRPEYKTTNKQQIFYCELINMIYICISIHVCIHRSLPYCEYND